MFFEEKCAIHIKEISGQGQYKLVVAVLGPGDKETEQDPEFE